MRVILSEGIDDTAQGQEGAVDVLSFCGVFPLSLGAGNGLRAGKIDKGHDALERLGLLNTGQVHDNSKNAMGAAARELSESNANSSHVKTLL